MPNFGPTIAATALLAFGFAATSAAQQAATAPADAYGSQSQDLWIAAEQFTGKFAGSPDLTNASQHYFNSEGSATPVIYYAPIQIPSGAQIQLIQCFVRDLSSVNDVTMGFQKVDHNLASNTPSTVFNRTWSSVGATGYQQTTLLVTAADGAVRYTVGDDRFAYYLTASVAADTFLRNCRIQYALVVSPAPAVATFPSDVPTTHPFFRFVEAMAASGLTGGCAPGSYCPDAPVTRGQMAVFVSTALGLHFPN